MAKNLLLVDDSVAIREVVALTFENAEVNILTSADQEEAWTALQEEPPDAVIADADKPQIGGWELCRKIKNDPALSSIPVILFSGEEEDEPGPVDVTPDALLSKPFSSDDLGKTVAALIGLELGNESPEPEEVTPFDLPEFEDSEEEDSPDGLPDLGLPKEEEPLPETEPPTADDILAEIEAAPVSEEDPPDKADAPDEEDPAAESDGSDNSESSLAEDILAEIEAEPEPPDGSEAANPEEAAAEADAPAEAEPFVPEEVLAEDEPEAITEAEPSDEPEVPPEEEAVAEADAPDGAETFVPEEVLAEDEPEVTSEAGPPDEPDTTEGGQDMDDIRPAVESAVRQAMAESLQSLDENELQQIIASAVRDALKELAPQLAGMVEEVARTVVPELAEIWIEREIKRLTGEE